MNKCLVSVLILVGLLASGAVTIQTGKSASKMIVVPDDYSTIQAAIENASPSDIVFVRSGSYSGGIIINKPISLIGEDSRNTKITGGAAISGVGNTASGDAFTTLKETSRSSPSSTGASPVVERTVNQQNSLSRKTLPLNFIPPKTIGIYLNASDIQISGFTIKGGDTAVNGNSDRLQLVGNVLGACSIRGSNMTIANNTGGFEIWGNFDLFTGNTGGLTLSCSNSTVTGNSLSWFALTNAYSNIITNNTITDANEGIIVGFYGEGSYNLIAGNTVKGAGLWGILMGRGVHNVFYGNLVTDTGGLGHDGYGVALGSTTNGSAHHNLFFHNAFANNSKNIGKNWPEYGTNFWDDGKEGNYWDDYLTKYPNATEIANSGTGNTFYVIDSVNIDNHPLMKQPSVSDAVPALPAPWSQLLPNSSILPSSAPFPTFSPPPPNSSPSPSPNPSPTSPTQTPNPASTPSPSTSSTPPSTGPSSTPSAIQSPNQTHSLTPSSSPTSPPTSEQPTQPPPEAAPLAVEVVYATIGTAAILAAAGTAVMLKRKKHAKANSLSNRCSRTSPATSRF
jgi:hypothetical protein